MLHDTQDRWISGHCSSPSTLETLKHFNEHIVLEALCFHPYVKKWGGGHLLCGTID
jgi:hypothetical protein